MTIFGAGLGLGFGFGLGFGAAVTAVPQLPQNFCPAGTGLVHFVHVTAVETALPQLPQNFCASGTVCLHLGHDAAMHSADQTNTTQPAIHAFLMDKPLSHSLSA